MYDRSRQHSALIRAGGDAIESGVRRMCNPIARRIDVAQLDSFACRQLTNLGYGMSTATAHHNGATAGNLRKRTKGQVERHVDGREQTAPLLAQADQTEAAAAGRGRGWGVGSLVASARERALAYREDSMRRLKYCLDWVAYATALLQQNMEDLQRLLASLQEAARMGLAVGNGTAVAVAGSHSGPLQQMVQDAVQRLARARREIVQTVRKAVGVVSHYAGAVLPSEARRQVRAMILSLPRRWAAADTSGGGSSVSGSEVGSPDAMSAASSPRLAPCATGAAGGAASADMRPENIEATTRRTLAFAAESFAMLGNIHGIFSNLHANAERWMGAAPESGHQMMDVEPATATYRDPSSGQDSAAQVPRPQRRLPPAASPPPATTTEEALGVWQAEAAASLVDIGEQMRRMDILAPQRNHKQAMLGVHGPWSAGVSPALRPAGSTTSSSSIDEAAAHKRSRTREPTPTRM
ncbi:transcriptional regulator opi1 [Coemansia spiralis]|nr:transcriptional regulator opi1 [Coemansia spiralis]